MPAKKKIDYEEFLRLNEDGWTITELAKHYDVNPRTISRTRKRLGIAHEYLGRPMTEERKNRIKQMLDDGWPHSEIVRTEHIDHHTIRKYFPGTAWTKQQHAEHMATIQRASHFNRRPRTYDRRKYETAA